MICFGESEHFRFNYPTSDSKTSDVYTPSSKATPCVSQAEHNNDNQAAERSVEKKKPKSGSFLFNLFESGHNNHQNNDGKSNSSSISSSFVSTATTSSSAVVSASEETAVSATASKSPKSIKTGLNFYKFCNRILIRKKCLKF
jgi:hypothetical protein